MVARVRVRPGQLFLEQDVSGLSQLLKCRWQELSFTSSILWSVKWILAGSSISFFFDLLGSIICQNGLWIKVTQDLRDRWVWLHPVTKDSVRSVIVDFETGLASVEHWSAFKNAVFVISQFPNLFKFELDLIVIIILNNKNYIFTECRDHLSQLIPRSFSNLIQIPGTFSLQAALRHTLLVSPPSLPSVGVSSTLSW